MDLHSRQIIKTSVWEVSFYFPLASPTDTEKCVHGQCAAGETAQTERSCVASTHTKEPIVGSGQGLRGLPFGPAHSSRVATVLAPNSRDSFCLVSSFIEMESHSMCSFESGFFCLTSAPLGEVVHCSFSVP